MNEPAKQSNGWVILAWLVVLLPAAWGVTQTVKKSLPLFSALGSHGPTAATAPATSP